jgi:hypothetical protein
MRFYANSVSASAQGDYHQLWLDVTDSNVEETIHVSRQAS